MENILNLSSHYELLELTDNELIAINGGADTPAEKGYEDGYAVGEFVRTVVEGLATLRFIFL